MIRQASIGGDLAHIALVQLAQGKQRLRKLRLIQPMQKITLVLGAILGLEQLPFTQELTHLRVMPGGDLVRAQRQGMVEKGLELDFRIA